MKLYLTLKHTSIRRKSFSHHFTMKMILLNILQNVAIYLFKYFALHIMIILRSEMYLKRLVT